MRKTLLISTLALLVFVVAGQRIIHTRVESSLSFIPDNIENTIREAKESVKETVVGKPNTTIFLVGDVMLGRSVMGTSIDAGDMSYPFAKVSTTLADSDIVFANLENPIIEDCKRHVGGFKFCAPPSMLAGLVESGINIVTLANNHSRNYGNEGLKETQVHLDNVGIKYTGLGELTIMEVNDTTFGFLGFDFFSNTPTEEDMQLIKDSNELVDVLIVGVHWGVEYTREPLPMHRELAQQMIDYGADIISGHHPHWVQTVDYLHPKGGQAQPPLGSNNSVPVYYSLGNFVFDQMWSEETKKGLAIKLTFEGSEIISEERMDTYMPQFAQPVFVE